MKYKRILTITLLIILCSSVISSQQATATKTIFAVLNDGKSLEPIAFIESGKLTEIGEAATGEKTADFAKKHYKPRTKYNLIFGGKNVGNVTVVKDLLATECATNQAEITVQSRRVTPKGFVMALATDAAAGRNVAGTRQLPTMVERREIEKLVMAEMLSNRVPIKNTGELRYHNLTKIDVDSNGKFEFVGTYWYNTAAKQRSLYFFIAEKGAEDVISIAFSRFRELGENDVMSGEIKALDDGIYHELLIDIFDVDNDGVGEIFTIVPAFEGSNFNAYKRQSDGKWAQVLETSNYHCGY